MTNKKSFPAILFLCLLCCTTLPAQEYHNTPVTVSSEKVRDNGKLYYSHVVLEKQTLFSIAKAYGVTMQEISEANPKLNLMTEGPKKNQVILIPIKEEGASGSTTAADADTTSTKGKNIFSAIGNTVKSAATGIQNVFTDRKQDSRQEVSGDGDEEFTVHTVKWYEDLSAIADKYRVSKESIIAYNKLSSPRVQKGMKLKIPKDPSAVAAVKEKQDETEAQEEQASVQQMATTAEVTEEEVAVAIETAEAESPSERNYLRAALLLPFNAGTGKVNDSNYDFYSGALLALKDLADAGLNVDLSVYDISRKGVLETAEIYNTNDVILGPISLENINDALDVCPADKIIISPLDPKTVSLAAGTPNFIQTPSTAEAQYNDLLEWIKEENKPEDKLIVISEKNMAATPLAEAVAKSGLEFETVNYGILEGRDITSMLQKLMTTTATNRVVVTSESEAFINDVVRNLNIMIFQKYDVVLYGPSRIRNFETIEVENYHNAKLHVSSSYFIDYDNNKVKRFLMEYRALFGAEPSPFAYQGYDTTYYFLQKCASGGIRWERSLESERFKGLQSDFLFDKVPEGGYYNKAVRRIVYEGDYSIKMVN